MRTPRHHLASVPIEAPEDVHPRIRDAERYEEIGNWYLAGDSYVKLAAGIPLDREPVMAAQVLARAATSYEVARQMRAAAAAYAEAAGRLVQSQICFAEAAQLYTRAAFANESEGDYFNAALHWRAAAEAILRDPQEPSDPAEAVPPIRGTGFVAAGTCYMAAGRAFEKSEEEKWSCAAYWQAGRAFARQFRGYHAYLGYRSALRACIRYYGTLEVSELRSILPLTEQERRDLLNPIDVMREERLLGNREHQRMNAARLKPEWADAETLRELSAAFRDFYLELLRVGNPREAGICRFQEKECLRQLYAIEKRYIRSLLYAVWRVTAGYGESLRRWLATCAIVLLIFAGLYAFSDTVTNARRPFDYLYFSVVTFSSLGYGDLHPEGIFGKSLACIQILLGLVMFGLLLTFVGSRVVRE